MAVIHIVSLSELRIADTAPKPHTGKQNYRRLRKTLKNAGDLGGRTKSTCVSRSVRTRARVREAERGICRHSIWPCTTRYGSTMENVALNHEKCRYCPFSSGNQERKESLLKKEQDEEGGSSSNFSSSLERVEAKTSYTTAFLLRLQGFKLKLFAFSSAGRYEERAAKLAKPHSLSGLPCSSHGTPSSPPTFASAAHPRKKANIGSYPLSLALA